MWLFTTIIIKLLYKLIYIYTIYLENYYIQKHNDSAEQGAPGGAAGPGWAATLKTLVSLLSVGHPGVVSRVCWICLSPLSTAPNGFAGLTQSTAAMSLKYIWKRARIRVHTKYYTTLFWQKKSCHKLFERVKLFYKTF